MPLHLLGKKSWNVYNPENIARVRRDEAAAKAAEEAEEQRMQEIDAQRRLAILRGEAPPPLEDGRHAEPAATREPAGSARHDRPGGTRRARRRHGEDDTDFELRLAQERSEAPTSTLAVARKPTSSAPIVDSAGHFDLFGDERSRAHADKNEEAERELQQKKREYEDQYRMRLSNAAGRDGRRPWYSQSDLAEAPSNDVWGNEDPRRREREAQRRAADDPLAMMKAASAQIRELNKERKKIEAEREEELRQLKREDRRREKAREREERERRHRSRSPRQASDRRRRRSRHGGDGGHGGHRDERRRRDDGRWRRQSHSPDRGPRRHRRDYD